MPVRFRCSGCRGKLSISRRKIGSQIECPRCGQPITVPGTEDTGEELTEMMAAGQSGAMGRFGLTPPPEPLPGSAEPMRLPPSRPQPPAAPAKPPQKRPPAPRSNLSQRLEDMPLFEQADVEQFLNPKGSFGDRPNREPEPLPLPESQPMPGNRTGVVGPPRIVDHDAIVLSRATASLAVLGLALLVALAFMIGRWVGAR